MKLAQRVRMPLAVEKAVPCHQCTDRQVGCHGSCEKYREWKAFSEGERAKIIQQVNNDSQPLALLKESYIKTQRRLYGKKAKR